jgi:hypothetical protein
VFEGGQFGVDQGSLPVEFLIVEHRGLKEGDEEFGSPAVGDDPGGHGPGGLRVAEIVVEQPVAASPRMRISPGPRGVVIFHQAGLLVASMASTLTTDHCGQFLASTR